MAELIIYTQDGWTVSTVGEWDEMVERWRSARTSGGLLEVTSILGRNLVLHPDFVTNIEEEGRPSRDHEEVYEGDPVELLSPASEPEIFVAELEVGEEVSERLQRIGMRRPELTTRSGEDVEEDEPEEDGSSGSREPRPPGGPSPMLGQSELRLPEDRPDEGLSLTGKS